MAEVTGEEGGGPLRTSTDAAPGAAETTAGGGTTGLPSAVVPDGPPEEQRSSAVAPGSATVIRRSERRVYLGGGAWQTEDGRQTAPAAPVPAPAPASGPRRVQIHPRLTKLWPVRVVCSLPLVCGAALSAGLGVYLLGLAFTVGDPGLSNVGLALCGAGALATSLVAALAWGVLLNERPRHPSAFVVIGSAAAGAVAAIVLAVLGFATVPCVFVGALLGYSALAPGILLALAAAAPITASPPQSASGFSRMQAGAPAGSGVSVGGRVGASSSGVWIDTPTRWSWDAPRQPGARSPISGILGAVGALVAVGAAVAVGFAAFSLFAESFVAGQAELGWQETLLSAALSGDGRGITGVVTLVLANLGLAALFGLLIWGAALGLGRWRGRIAWRWALVLTALVVAGLIAWLVDGSLPRL